jgi:lysophospholipase L1-like esterase
MRIGGPLAAEPASYETRPRPTFARRMLYYTISLILASVLLLCLFELVARLAGFGERVQYDSSLSVLWQPRPNQHTYNNLTNAPVTIDSRGLRAVPFTRRGAENRVAVLALGDSVTFGFALSDEETYLAHLQSFLEAVEPGRWLLMNGGVNGYNFFLVKQRLVYLLESGIKPDLLLIGFCFNEYPTWPGEHFSDEERAAIVQGVEWKNRLRSVALFNFSTEVISPTYFYRLRNAFMPAGASTNAKTREPEVEWLSRYRRRIGTLFSEAAQRGIPVMVLIWSDKQRVLGGYRSVLLEECAARNIPCLNLDSILKGRDTSQMFFDFEHPRPDTVKLYVEQGIAPFFQSYAHRLLEVSSSASSGTR